jgi:isopropylmalate/homocitrate/citramalate synthase
LSASSDSIPVRVRVVEVGGRDGLQNEPGTVATADKVRYLELLSEAGFDTIEVGSFVRPDRIPQLADTEAVFARLEKRPGVRYVALVPNEKGLERALAAGVRDIAVFTASSETFNRRNINMGVDESLALQRRVIERGKREGMWVRGYVSTVFGCPYEGAVAEERSRDVAGSLLDMGCDEISLGDTIGVGTPRQVERVVSVVRQRVPLDRLALHFHDTRGTALANVLAALGCGIAVFDASSGGLGGCPYAPGASGNLSTEDLLYMLHGMDIETGVSLEKVVAASRFVAGALGRTLPSRYLQAAGATE